MKDSRGDRTARGGFSFRSHRDIRRPPFAAPASSQSSAPRHTTSHGDRTAPGGFSFRSHRDIRRPPSRPPRRPNPQPRGIQRHTETGWPRGDFLSAVIAAYDAPPLRGPAASRGEAPRRPASRGEAPRRSPVPRSVPRGAAGSVDVSPLPRSPDFSAVRCQHRRMPAPKRPMPEDSARRTKKPPFRRRRRCCGSERRSMRIFVPPEREGEGPEKKAGTSAQGLRRHAQAARTIKN